ncbi:MAG: ABC transporter permease, partial [Deltaproteobacteria bacterium]|nr:ABC transporter permease [Deltaproteobacteria bacterium]
MGALSKLAAYFRTALVSLYLNRLRSLLSILGIVFGVMAVMVIIAVGEGMKNEALRQIEQLGICNIYLRAVETTAGSAAGGRRRDGGLTLDDLERLQSGCGAVERVAALRELNVAIIGAPREITPQVVAVTPSYGEVLGLRLAAGRFLTRRDRELQKEVCVIGREISRVLGRAGQLGGVLRIEDHFFKVVGILERSRRPRANGKTAA